MFQQQKMANFRILMCALFISVVTVNGQTSGTLNGDILYLIYVAFIRHLLNQIDVINHFFIPLRAFQQRTLPLRFGFTNSS